jgi:thioredoxin 1
MRIVPLLAGLLLPVATSFGSLGAATIQKYQERAFEADQRHGDPILVFVEASWCPTCAKERPILNQLYTQPEFQALKVFDVDFDTSKPLLRHLHVQMQSTLVVYHGAKETGRLTGATDPAVIEHLLETAGT